MRIPKLAVAPYIHEPTTVFLHQLTHVTPLQRLGGWQLRRQAPRPDGGAPAPGLHLATCVILGNSLNLTGSEMVTTVLSAHAVRTKVGDRDWPHLHFAHPGLDDSPVRKQSMSANSDVQRDLSYQL